MTSKYLIFMLTIIWGCIFEKYVNKYFSNNAIHLNIFYCILRIAFESLKTDLDPENKNIPLTKEMFFDIMNKWAKKIASSNDEDEESFNRTPR